MLTALAVTIIVAAVFLLVALLILEELDQLRRDGVIQDALQDAAEEAEETKPRFEVVR